MEPANRTSWGEYSLSYDYLESLMEVEASASWAYSAVGIHGIGALALFDAMLLDSMRYLAYSINIVAKNMLSDQPTNDIALRYVLKATECSLKAIPLLFSTIFCELEQVEILFFEGNKKDKLHQKEIFKLNENCHALSVKQHELQ